MKEKEKKMKKEIKRGGKENRDFNTRTIFMNANNN